MPKNYSSSFSRLSKAILDCSYEYRPPELLRWTVEQALEWMEVCKADIPEHGRAKAKETARFYFDAVREAPPFEDLLGETYMAVASSGHQRWLGQYFTPGPVARMMAAMTIDKPGGEPNPAGYLWRACDPTSGSGVMMLAAAAHVLSCHGAAALAFWSFTMVDLDRLCSLMSAAQMLANCVVHGFSVGELIVFHGNSLGRSDAWKLIAHATVADLPEAASLPAVHPARIEAIHHAAATAGLQLDLFASVNDESAEAEALDTLP